jgi:hypothetical protein
MMPIPRDWRFRCASSTARKPPLASQEDEPEPLRLWELGLPRQDRRSTRLLRPGLETGAGALGQ